MSDGYRNPGSLDFIESWIRVFFLLLDRGGCSVPTSHVVSIGNAVDVASLLLSDYKSLVSPLTLLTPSQQGGGEITSLVCVSGRWKCRFDTWSLLWINTCDC